MTSLYWLALALVCLLVSAQLIRYAIRLGSELSESGGGQGQ